MDFGQLIAAADFSWLNPQSWWAIAQVVLGIGLVIFIHELGHFLVAKACGVKCEKFYVGFDAFNIKIGDRVLIPRSLVKFQYGETEYGVGILPLGGYVKMLGQEDNPSSIEHTTEDGQPVDPELVRQSVDPRSYRAKTVLQRMAIISAGVVFNLISAVFMAAIAFNSGVSYTPPAVGITTIGGPAWRANMGGNRILAVNDRVTSEGYFPFVDLIQETALNGAGQAMKMELQSYGSSESRTVLVTPQPHLVPGLDLPLVGIQPEMAAKIGNSADAIVPNNAASRASPPLKPGDEIVAINGRKLPTIEIDGQNLTPVTEMRGILTELADQTVTMTIRRTDPETQSTVQLEISVPPNLAPTTGLVMQVSPIVAVQDDSPAATAGIASGDTLVTINGEPIGDVLTLDQRISRMIRNNSSGEVPFTIEMGVRRAGTKTSIPAEKGNVPATVFIDGNEILDSSIEMLEHVTLVPRLPIEPSIPNVEAMAISTLGVALHPTTIVADVIQNSPAAAAGIQAGDRIRKVKLLGTENPDPTTRVGQLQISIRKSNADRQPGWLARLFGVLPSPPDDRMGTALNIMRDLPAGTAYEITFERNSEMQPAVTLKSVDDTGDYLPTRGMMLAQLESVYHAKSMVESLKLGLRQTWNDAGRIGRTLGKLVSGQISPKNLGGPGTIAVVATMEASEGTSRLLLFLTMLSANLAIVNFLPIPILDGGHMAFLAYEGIFRRPVTEKVQALLSWVGLFMILGLMIFVFGLDISRIFTWLQ